MPKYYCDYCDTFLTHDSASVRKSHIDGIRHQAAVRAYYAQLAPEYQEAPDREAMRYEKMKDDAMQFMMMGPPMMAMGGFPPMMPPVGFAPGFPPYGPPPPQNNAPRYDARGPPRFDGGWNDKKSAPRADGRGPGGDASHVVEPRWDDRSGPLSDTSSDKFRGYVNTEPSEAKSAYASSSYAAQGSSAYASSSAPPPQWR